MSERNLGCTNQILDMELELGHNYAHPEPHLLFGNAIGYSTPSAHPSQVVSGIPANVGFQQFLDHSGSNSVYGNPYSNLQYNCPVANFDMGFSPSNFSSNSYVASSSSRPINSLINNGAPDQLLVSGNQRIMGVTMEEHGSNGGYINNFWGLKRKNEGIPDDYFCADGVSNFDSSSINLSMNFGRQHQNETYEAGPSLSDAPPPFLPEQQGSMMNMTDGSQENVRSRNNTIDLQLESSFMHHRNHLFQENYMPHFQPAGTWPDQFGNNVNDGGVSNQTYTHSTPFLLGYPGATSSRNAAMPHPPPAIYNHHHPILPGQGMRAHNHTQYQVPPPLAFGRPVNNFQFSNLSAPRDSVHLGPRFTRLVHSNASDGTFRPRRLQATRDYSDGRMRFLHPEHVAFLDVSSSYEDGNHSDQHSDMRLDIDSMSYEELLALEEHIGDVSIGLSEESILKHLKTRIHVPQLASLCLNSSCSAIESETCVICQVEFEENERIGILDCGHDYHADCIKQWLLLKNLCPICKTTAIEEEKRKGDGWR